METLSGEYKFRPNDYVTINRTGKAYIVTSISGEGISPITVTLLDLISGSEIVVWSQNFDQIRELTFTEIQLFQIAKTLTKIQTTMQYPRVGN